MNETKELSIEELEKIISMLESKSEELLDKIHSSKYAIKNNTKINLLTVGYATLCGCIVDLKTALVTAVIGGVSCIGASSKDVENHIETVDNYIGNTAETIAYETALERKMSK